MPAPIGNKNAEKWTEDTVLEKLSEITQEIEKQDVTYLGTALANIGLYHQIWSDWKEKFKDNDVVSDTIKRIEQKTESKLFEGGLSGNLNSTVVIFGLKNNHEWKDKSSLELEGKLDTNININIKPASES